MIDIKKIEYLVRELKREAYYEGHDAALYEFNNVFHTVEKRKDILNHKRIAEQVQKEIGHLLNGTKEFEAES